MSGGELATPEHARDLLQAWLSRRLAQEESAWLEDKRTKLARDKEFYLAFALATRKLGKRDLALTPDELAEAATCRAGWSPAHWSVDQAARLVLLLTDLDAETFARRLEKLCATGDVGELVALYEGLPIYPNPDSLAKRAAEGLRSNIKAVFEAIAHHNPYPADHLEEGPWNQMVLKALFIGSSLHPIQGLDRRANEQLARILIDYAHERWAARRQVSPELWRCVGPWINDSCIGDLERAWATEDPLEKQAVAFALASSKEPRAQALLAQDPTLDEAVNSGKLTWSAVHESLTLK